MSRSIEDAILDLLAERAPGQTICPSEAARRAWGPGTPATSAAADADGWRRLMPQVRATAVGMARRGRLVITRKGAPADPDSFKGVYRLRLP